MKSLYEDLYVDSRLKLFQESLKLNGGTFKIEVKTFKSGKIIKLIFIDGFDVFATIIPYPEVKKIFTEIC
jgi:hypothetical protein